MAYRIKLKANHPYPSYILADPKMIVTKDFKTLAKKTEEIKRLEKYFIIETIPAKVPQASTEPPPIVPGHPKVEPVETKPIQEVKKSSGKKKK